MKKYLYPIIVTVVGVVMITAAIVLPGTQFILSFVGGACVGHAVAIAISLKVGWL